MIIAGRGSLLSRIISQGYYGVSRSPVICKGTTGGLKILFDWFLGLRSSFRAKREMGVGGIPGMGLFAILRDC